MERSQELVIDASVALKWFVEEENSEIALEVLDHVSSKALPSVPSLFFYEITNVLRYKPEFGIKDIQEVFSALSGFGFLVSSLQDDLGDLTIDLAFRYGIPIYDASYLAISQKKNCHFVTADVKLFEKLAEEKVILLKDWK
jgi:predicted nucleic acid-binding protein